MSLNRILRLVKKEFIQLRRDPQMLRLIIVAPVFQLFVFGYAVTTDIKHVNLAVFDEDRSAAGRELTERFVRSGYFDLRYFPSSHADIDALLDSGRAHLVLHIPAGFGADLARNRTARIQLLLDGSDSMTAGTVYGYAAGAVQEYSEKIAAERLDRVRGRLSRLPSIVEKIRVWFNPELKSVNFMVPGILSMILFLVTMLLTSLAIVKEREIGTLEQLIVTPITSRELMLGKTIPYIVIGYVDMVLVLAVAMLWFGVPIRGSMALLFILAGVFIFTNLGLGLFVSTVSRTQQQAMMTAFFLMLPSMLLSGFIFPIDNMPIAIRWLTYGIPLRYFLVIVRGIFLKGNGLAELWGQVAILAAYGLAILGSSALRFRKRLG